MVDVYRGTAGCQKNPAKLALYVAFFPELVAGPIVRYTTVEGEIDGRRETWEDFSWGARRFLEGMCKKVLISNTMANVADYAFGLTGTADLTMGLAWLGAVAYTFQIYFDFPGIRTWPSDLDGCSAFIFWKTLTGRISPDPSRSSGDGGIFPWEAGFGITCTFPWEETG